MNMNEDDPPTKVWHHLYELMYGDQPAGRKILGTKENILKFTQNDFLKYHHAYYLPNRTVISIAGGVPFNEIKKHVVSSFGHLVPGNDIIKKKTQEEQKTLREKIILKDVSQTHFILGFRAFSFSDKRRYHLSLLRGILGSGSGSRLWQKVREELGAAYYIYATSDLSSDHGCFAIAAGVDHGKLKEVLSVIRKECLDIVKNGISQEELNRTKRRMVASQLISRETSDDWAFFYGGQEILRDNLETTNDVIREYEKVTCKQVQSVAKYLFQNKKMNLAIVGPFKNKKFGDIVKL
jgi:predicted Zn-dependent peptidase